MIKLTIEGGIGSGKTELVRTLSKALNLPIIHQSLSKWDDVIENPCIVLYEPKDYHINSGQVEICKIYTDLDCPKPELRSYLPLSTSGPLPPNVTVCEDSCIKESFYTGTTGTMTYDKRRVKTERVYQPFGKGSNVLLTGFNGIKQTVYLKLPSDLYDVSVWDGEEETPITISTAGLAYAPDQDKVRGFIVSINDNPR